MKDDYLLCFDVFFSFFRALMEKKMGISLLNRLQPVAVAFLTLINKFSDRDRDKVKFVAFLENVKSLVVVLAKHSP